MFTDAFRRRFVLSTLAGCLAIAGLPADVSAKVFYARDEALELAFPGADRVETRDVYLTDEQRSRIQALARAPLETSLVTVYAGWKDGKITSWAVFDTHDVRTFPETLLVVLTADGKIAATHVLAFHEPQEYLPPARWLETLAGKSLDDDLMVGRGVTAITGSTLSTRALTAGLRRALAIWAVAVGGQ